MNKFKKGLIVKSANIKIPTMYNMYSKDGEYIGKINSKYAKMQNKYLKVITILLETQNQKIIMEKRGNTVLTPGEIDFCSGHVENSETYMQTAYREANEELGLEEHKIKNLTKISEPLIIDYRGKRFFIQFFYGKVNSQDIKIDNEEVISYYEEDINIAFQNLRNGKTRFPYKGNEDSFEKVIKGFETIRENLEKVENKERI